MKPLQRCQNGHYFDSDKHSACPFCGIQELNVDVRRTMAKKQEAESSGEENPIPVTRPQQVPGNVGGENKTVGMFKKHLGIDPVVGWLVAVTGPEKGKDYRIVAEKNLIGRSESMDIAISGDASISRENHAIVSYNPKKNIFRLFPGESKRLVYLNDDEVITPEELKPFDVIELGETKLQFVPFCCEHFQWKKEEE